MIDESENACCYLLKRCEVNRYDPDIDFSFPLFDLFDLLDILIFLDMSNQGFTIQAESTLKTSLFLLQKSE